MLSHPEVSRAIEQELIEVLIVCWMTAKTRTEVLSVPHCAMIMSRFENILGQHLGQLRNIPELCELIGVSARALRACCAQFLGMSPARYVLLRRLREVRNTLLRAD